MKALLISDRPEIIDFVTPLLKNKGFDLIHYRWIIKALDNIEEIQPDVIVLSAAEYPRHWKTLAGFVQSGIGGNDVKLYLYDTEPLSEEESRKAENLGFLSFEESFNKDCITEKVIDYLDVELALNDTSGKMRFYNAQYNPERQIVKFECDNAKIENGFIKYVSMFDGRRVLSFCGDITKAETHNACLFIKEYYEKEI